MAGRGYGVLRAVEVSADATPTHDSVTLRMVEVRHRTLTYDIKAPLRKAYLRPESLIQTLRLDVRAIRQ